MCKIVTFTNSKNIDVVKASKKIGNILLNIERDGFGYAVQGLNGVFGEKCVASSFSPRIDLSVCNPIGAIKPKYDRFGVKSKPVGPMILHGRTSTNDRGLLNCHPMIARGNYLIHNGVVTDHGPKYDKGTTNDSEDVLHRFLEGIDSVTKNLTGYYAFSCIDSTGLLHVVRDRTATLYIGWIDKLDTYIIATTESLLESVVKSIGATVDAVDEIREDVYMIFKGNEMISCTDIKSRGYGERESRFASKSLGYDLNDCDYSGYITSPSVDGDYAETALDNDYDDDREYYLELSGEAFDRRVANVDDRYEIEGPDGYLISAFEFKKLDNISKRQCVIWTPDGSVIEFVDDIVA